MPGLARGFVYPWLRHPAVLGTDVAGVVVAVGEPGPSGPVRLAVGDRVVGFASGQERFRNDPAYGAFQRFVVLAADLTARVPDDVRLVDAAVLPLGLSTAGAGLFEPDQLGLALPGAEVVDRGATVLVWGASTSVGSNAVQLATAAGYRVVATAGPASFTRGPASWGPPRSSTTATAPRWTRWSVPWRAGRWRARWRSGGAR